MLSGCTADSTATQTQGREAEPTATSAPIAVTNTPQAAPAPTKTAELPSATPMDKRERFPSDEQCKAADSGSNSYPTEIEKGQVVYQPDCWSLVQDFWISWKVYAVRPGDTVTFNRDNGFVYSISTYNVPADTEDAPGKLEYFYAQAGVTIQEVPDGFIIE